MAGENTDQDQAFMRLALEEAQSGFEEGGVPINFEETIYVSSPKRTYDVLVQLPIAHRIPLLLDPIAEAGDPWRYRSFIQNSRAELMVAKNLYVETRSGWMSDRSTSASCTSESK